ncbi:hypothetical protein ACU4GD_34225 [Cupriavidus basilensis]
MNVKLLASLGLSITIVTPLPFRARSVDRCEVVVFEDEAGHCAIAPDRTSLLLAPAWLSRSRRTKSLSVDVVIAAAVKTDADSSHRCRDALPLTALRQLRTSTFIRFTEPASSQLSES